jgi:hypothetical protein
VTSGIRAGDFAVTGQQPAPVPGYDPVEIRCTHCGTSAMPAARGIAGDCLLLSDLLDWAGAHQCPPPSVT